MSPVNIPENFMQIACHFNVRNQHASVSLFGAAFDALSFDQAAADDLGDGFAGTYRVEMLADNSTYTKTVFVANVGGVLQELVSLAGAGVGGHTGEFTPPQVMGLVVKNTALQGRKFRGRTFVPDLLDSEVSDSGDLISGGLTRLTDFAGDITTVMNTEPLLGQYLLHEPDTVPTLVTSYAASNRVATLRRRFER